ncbi:MAG: hypothetical protein KBC33_00755 [Candidatus Pacebacteria bacterium]|nr:hypothetical protein [Candidatus Paceibacterota bacterium]
MNRNVTATILIVLAIGIYVTFTRAKLAEVKAVRQVNDQYLAAIDNADKLVEVRKKVLDSYNAISDDDRERLDKMIPNTVDNIRLIIDLNGIANDRGLSLRNVKAVAASAAKQGSSGGVTSQPAIAGGGAAAPRSTTIPTPTLDTVAVSFSVTASYQQFIDLLRDLEGNLRIMDVSRLTVSAGQNGMYDFGVELKTYWLRQQ